MERDPEFVEEFKRVFNNYNIPEADGFTTQVPEYTYVDMEIALPTDGEGPKRAKVKTYLWDENGIRISRQHDNPILDTRVCEVEYLDGHKAALAANTIAENLFSQVDLEGNIFK